MKSRSRRAAPQSETEERLGLVHLRLAAVLAAIALTLARRRLQPNSEALWARELRAAADMLQGERHDA